MIKYDSWASPSGFERDPARIERIMRSPAMVISPIDAYLEKLESASGESLAALRSATRNALVYQTADEHRATRRLIAGFFNDNTLASWQGMIDEAVEAALDRLNAAPRPDLMGDFVIPLFLSVITRLVGFQDDGSGKLFPMIATAQRMTEPLLSLRDLRALNAAIIYLSDILPDLEDAPKGEPECLLAYLNRKRASGPAGVDLRQAALVLLLAANTASQTLGFALFGLLMGEAKEWRDAAAQEWEKSFLDHVLSLYLPTLTLVRLPREDVEIGGCPYAAGQPVVMDMVAANAALREAARQDPTKANRTHMSFGAGPHKCPGEALSRRLLGAAIPKLARRFPRLTLHRELCRFTATPMVQAPVSLPCELHGLSQRASTRLIEIRDIETARQVVKNDDAFGPPEMEKHLRALAAASPHSLDTPIRVARNALFLMSGARHAAARRAVADLLGGARLRPWEEFVAAQTRTVIEAMGDRPIVDLVRDFAHPLGLGVARAILGIDTHDSARFEELAPVLQDLQEPWLSMRDLLRLRDAFAELMDLLRLPDAGVPQPATPVLPGLLAAEPPGFDADDIKALVLILYGASFNLSQTLANILYRILIRPVEECAEAASPEWVAENLERLIGQCAAPKYIYRMAREPGVLANGIEIGKGDTLRVHLLSVNRDAEPGHLSFGHGLHHCVGAGMSRLVLRHALPAFFQRFPGAILVPQAHDYRDMSQTVALARLPCRLAGGSSLVKENT